MDKQLALITGASQGLGWEFCRQLVAAGHMVLLTARNLEKAEQAIADLPEEDRGRVRIYQLDVTDEGQIKSLAAEVKETFGQLDLLINNAGINSRSNSTHEQFLASVKLEGLDGDTLMRMIRINALSSVLMVKHFLPLLAESSQAKVANISSWIGSISQKNQGGNYGYAGSKALLNMFTRTMAHDLKAHGVNCIALNPGWVRTAMGGQRANLSPEESVAGMLSVLDQLDEESRGKFLQWDGSEHPW
ncbi:MAG: SDR family oxidoreductase [Bacteroidota bacterium]